MTVLAALDWHQIALFAQHSTGLSADALQVIVGVVLQLFVALVFKSSLGRATPLLAVLAFALFNEANDWRVTGWSDPGRQFGEAAKDIVAIMFVPALIFIVARRRPRLLVQGSN